MACTNGVRLGTGMLSAQGDTPPHLRFVRLELFHQRKTPQYSTTVRGVSLLLSTNSPQHDPPTAAIMKTRLRIAISACIGSACCASCYSRFEISSLELECSRSFASSKRINNFDIARISYRHWPFGLHARVILLHGTQCLAGTPATSLPTQELERTTNFRSSRFMCTTAEM